MKFQVTSGRRGGKITALLKTIQEEHNLTDETVAEMRTAMIKGRGVGLDFSVSPPKAVMFEEPSKLRGVYRV